MTYQLIIAEKPSVGKEIAAVVGANEKTNEGYYQGNGYIVFWAYGHLVGLAMPDVYGEKEWNLNRLPFIPNTFIYEVGQDAGVKKQFNLLKILLNRPDVNNIICATDAGREGEAIFRYIYYQADCKKNFQRLWISSLTEESIRNGMKNLHRGEDYDNLYYSAKARNEADWIIGINATRAITLSTGSRSVISLGRVQTPTLALIVSRFIENKDFKPQKYFTTRVNIINEETKLEIKSPIKFGTQEDAERYLEKINRLKVTDIKETRVEEKPPLPFDLTSLQIKANKSFGFKAQKTLDIAQALYEKKILSYPRTSSRYLGEDMYSDVNIIVDKLVGNSIVKQKPIEVMKFCFDNSKLSDHYAIIPTGEHLDTISKLSQDEKIIFDAVVQQFIAALHPKCIKDKVEYTLMFDTEEESLKFTATTIIEQGWRCVGEDDKEDKEDENTNVPKLEKGKEYDVVEKRVNEEKTKPLPLHTEASLLRMMETAGNSSEDEEIRRIMKECGLGTPATRAGIIETLFARKFIQLEKKNLIPTELGQQVFELVKELPIANVGLTGNMERGLNEIAEGKKHQDSFYDEVKQMNSLLIEEIKKTKVQLTNVKETEFTCPVCKSQILEIEKAYKCSGEKCKFIFWKTIAKKDISKNAADFFKNGETKIIEGFKNTEGKTFSAKIVFDNKQERYLSFRFPAPEEQTSKCLLCKSSLLKYSNSISCSEKCGFFIPMTIAGKNIGEKNAQLLAEGKKTLEIKGFKSKQSKLFNASLIYNIKEKKIDFIF